MVRVWLADMEVFGVIWMGTGGHRGPSDAETGIANTLKSNFCGVVTHDRVIAKKEEEVAAAFGHRFEFCFVGELLKQILLLISGAIHEFMPELGSRARVNPCKTRKEAILRFVAGRNGVCGRAYFVTPVYGHAIGDHEVDELRDAGLLGSRIFIGRDDHVGEMHDHAKVGIGEKKRLVRFAPNLSLSAERFVDVSRGAGKRPSAEAGKSSCNCGDADIAKNLAALHALSGHLSLRFASWRNLFGGLT